MALVRVLLYSRSPPEGLRYACRPLTCQRHHGRCAGCSRASRLVPRVSLCRLFPLELCSDNSLIFRDHTFKIPARFTLHESKKLSFVADLANPSVPLHRLTKSIPHGYKGLDLLEMLWKNGVSLERGIWFAKVIGANEMVRRTCPASFSGMVKEADHRLCPLQQPPRGKPPPPPDQYCLDWTTALVSWLKKQLADIALPSAPRAGFNIKQTFKSILSDEKSRARWIAKWEYSCVLPFPCLLRALSSRTLTR